MTKVAIFTHEAFLEHDTGPSHPECAQRLVAIRRGLEAPELAPHLLWRTAPEATLDALLTCHHRDHVERVLSTTGGDGRLDPDTCYSPGTARAALLAAGCALRAAEVCLSGEEGVGAAFALVRPPGHHATPDRAMGFCFFNNAGIAARRAQALGARRVLIIDWDVHHGNGTQDIFYEDDSVAYYSLHLHPHYPGTGMAYETGDGPGRGRTLNRPLPPGFPADAYRKLFVQDLEVLLARFEPGFVVLSCGFDSHAEDPLGGLLLQDSDFAFLTRAVCERMPPGRVMSVLEGGYNLETIGGSARAHVAALAGL